MRAEDHLLADENAPSLNDSFYRGEPHKYLRTRMLNLIVFAARPDIVWDTLREGVTYEGLQAGIEPDSDADTDDDGKYVTLEVEAIRHHTAETLLRLVLAHVALPPCPWLEVSRLRSPREFKGAVTAWVAKSSDDRLADVRLLFLGSTERDHLPGLPDELWEEDCARIAGWLERASSVILNDAPLYNVVKHGLAIQSGDSGLAFGEEGDGGGPPIRKSGRSLVYLSVRESAPNRPQWHQSIRWVNFRQAVAEVEFYVRLIERLWMVARKRYTGEPATMTIRPVLAFEAVRSASQHTPGPFFVDEAHLSLLYYKPPE